MSLPDTASTSREPGFDAIKTEVSETESDSYGTGSDSYGTGSDSYGIYSLQTAAPDSVQHVQAETEDHEEGIHVAYIEVDEHLVKCEQYMTDSDSEYHVADHIDIIQNPGITCQEKGRNINQDENNYLDNDNELKGCLVQLEASHENDGAELEVGDQTIHISCQKTKNPQCNDSGLLVSKVNELKNDTKSWIKNDKISGNRKINDTQCPVGQEMFVDTVECKYHVLESIKEEKLLECGICKLVLTSDNGMREHVAEQHSESSALYCFDCGKIFSSRKSLRRHIKKVHNSVVDKTLLKYQCKNCSRNFETVEVLKEHKVKDKCHKCDVCNKGFGSYGQKRRHFQQVHAKDKPHKCDACGKGFSETARLKKHFLAVHSESKSTFASQNSSEKLNDKLQSADAEADRMRECSICKLLMDSLSELKGHVNDRHSEYAALYCFDCGKTFSLRKSLRRHIKHIHNSVTYNIVPKPQCSVCLKNFATAKLLEKHMIMKNCPICHVCGRIFRDKGQVRMHVQRVHPGEDAGNESNKCELCQKEFFDQGKLDLHFMEIHSKGESVSVKCNSQDHDEVQANKTHSGLSSSSLSEVKESPQDELTEDTSLYCCKCEKTFSSQKELNDHREMVHKMVMDNMLLNTQHKNCSTDLKTTELLKMHHVKDTCHKCHICGKEYSDNVKMKRHFRNVHSTDKPRQCDICGKEFNQVRKLKKHVRAVHSGNKQVSLCNICGKGFADIRKHMLGVHSDDRPFKCTVCSAAYKCKRNLIAHIRTHTGERPFVCTYCNMAFNTQPSLKKHVKTHTGEYNFECEYCGSRFIDKASRERHYRVHTGEKPYKCHLCPSAHSTRSALKIHIRRHTGEKPYMCSECGAAFIAYSCLKNHMKSHHGLSLKIDKYELKMFQT